MNGRSREGIAKIVILPLLQRLCREGNQGGCIGVEPFLEKEFPSMCD
jgi:hypothetical protein